MTGKHEFKDLNNNTQDISEKKSGSRKRYYIIGIVSLWIVLLTIIGSIAIIIINRPNRSKVTAARITIPRGFNSSQIANKLAKAGIVGNAYTFRLYAIFNNIDNHFLPGKYRLSSNMSYQEIAKKLAAGPKKKLIKVVIPEGFTLKEINRRLAEKTGRSEASFVAATSGPEIYKYDFKYIPTGAKNLEGYLFPKTYQFDKTMGAKKIISRLLYQFQLETENLDWSLAEQKSLSRKDIVTIASLIEKEAKVPEERSLMAAVIYNRLALRMPLQIDATIQYVLPERKDRLTLADTKFPSPYNTYLNPGLPPGPIANPGLNSIKAALAPAPVDYLYYVLTSPDGHHTFTRNYADFLKAKRQAGN